MTPKEAAELNLKIAKAEGYKAIISADSRVWLQENPNGLYEPLTDGNLIVALMEKYMMNVGCFNGSCWDAYAEDQPVADISHGSTIGEAVCRCVCQIHYKPEGGR